MHKRHPLSAVFPDITGDDYEALKRDIVMNGQLNPIVFYENMILDGWNRYRACEELHKRPQFVQLPKTIDPVKFVIGQNLHRRHLTVAQRVTLAKKLLAEEEKRAKERQKDLAGTRKPKTLAPTGAKVRDDRGKATQKVAAVVGVSARSVERSKAIDKTAVPEVRKAVDSGEMSLREAERVAKLPKKQQRAEARKPKGERKVKDIDPERDTYNRLCRMWVKASPSVKAKFLKFVKEEQS